MTGEPPSIPLSAVERYAFCPRQAYLFHAEHLKAENRFTVEGSFLHRKVTEADDEIRGENRIVRALQVASQRLGVFGVADVVEFRGEQPIPVEYKRGAATGKVFNQAQLCLQALCLEEMLGIPVPVGHIYHGATRRREIVPIDSVLRATTERLVGEVHALLAQPVAPPARVTRGCESCSLVEACLPQVTGPGRSVENWLERELREKP